MVTTFEHIDYKERFEKVVLTIVNQQATIGSQQVTIESQQFTIETLQIEILLLKKIRLETASRNLVRTTFFTNNSAGW